MSLEVLSQFGEQFWCMRHESFVTFAANADTQPEMKVGRVPKVKGGVAVIPIEGPLTPKGGWDSVSMNALGNAIDVMGASDRIGGIVLYWDSPGGTYTGTPELAEKIYAMRGVKPIISMVSPMMASGALWVGSAADKVIISTSSSAGSHGVFSVHVDRSKAAEANGVKVTYVSAGKYKVEGNPYEPASEEFIANSQETVNRIYDEFTTGLAKNYGLSKSHILENFGQGRMLSPAQAEKAGMVHGIDTLENVISRMTGGGTASSHRADADQSRILAEAFGVSDESPQVTAEQLRLQKKRKKRVQMLTSPEN